MPTILALRSAGDLSEKVCWCHARGRQCALGRIGFVDVDGPACLDRVDDIPEEATHCRSGSRSPTTTLQRNSVMTSIAQ